MNKFHQWTLIKIFVHIAEQSTAERGKSKWNNHTEEKSSIAGGLSAWTCADVGVSVMPSLFIFSMNRIDSVGWHHRHRGAL